MNKAFNIASLFLLGIIATGCLKTNQPTVVLPTGTFTGPFTIVHLSTKTGKLDTAKANLILTLSVATGFTVTGDTSKVHAGSHGTYDADGTYMAFSDKTLPATATVNTPVPVKRHLNGIFQYKYDGTNLQIYGSNDTLAFSYVLKAN
jgi:hypothetical protein